MMKINFLIPALCIAQLSFASTEKKYTQQEYVSMWKETAVKQMNLHKVPASITLAQGILESGNGNSDLARQANNHFGIKCPGWKGDTFYKDDDQKGECFRKYADAGQSYEDHSLFLKGKTRYAALFNLELTDYKGWAQGLKDAGYATNPKYPQLLTEIIERLKLDEFDKANAFVVSTTKAEVEKKAVKTIMMNTHSVEKHVNGDIKFIVAKKGDTYYRISKEFQLGMWQLYKYNEFGDKKDYLEEGDIIYLQQKKRKSKHKAYFEAKEDISLRNISQKEGIKVQRLMKMNNISSPDETIHKGKKIALK
ncbi:MAG: glucosaminidase domain-containing protein [Bacteroidota bacterium]